MRGFKRTISILLSLIIILSVFTIAPFTVNAEQTTDSSPAYVAYQAKRYSDPYGQNLFGEATQTHAQIYYNQMKNDNNVVSGIAIWEAAHIVTSPTYSLESGLITKKDMYKLAIFDMLDLSESDTFVSNLLNVVNDSRLSYIVSVSKSICDPNDIKVSELKNFEVNAEYLNFLKESAKLAKALDVVDKISTIASGCENLYEAILTTANYQAISDMKNGTKEVLTAIYADTSNPFDLRQAAYECVNNFGDGFDRILNTVSTGNNLCLNATLETIIEEAVNSIWDELISAIPGGKVVMIAAKGMRVLSNAVFSMDDTCRIYYQFEADVILEQAIRNVMNNARCDYIQDKNQDKAVAYMRAVEMYKRIVLQGYEYTKEMLEIKANAPATQWFDWLNHDYSECMELIEGNEKAKNDQQNLYKQFEEWVHSDYINLYCKDYNETINDFNNQQTIKTDSVTLTQIKDINVGDSGYIYDYIQKSCQPENSVEYKKCYFTADNKDIFTIDKLGSFVAESAGQVTLTYDQGGELEKSITITIGSTPTDNKHDYYSDFIYSIGNYSNKTAYIYGYIGTSSNLVIPSSIDGYTIEYIQHSTFENCTTLVNVTIPDTINGGIGYDAFKGCTNLRTIKIGNSVTSIGESAFENCSNLSNVIIGNNVHSIYPYAFKNCNSLNSIIIPDSVTLNNIHWNCEIFSGCTNLKSVEIGNSVSIIGPEMFKNCKNLANITIGRSVKEISYGAFEGCNNLKKCNFSGTIDDWCAIEYSGIKENWPTYFSKNLYINGELIEDIKITVAINNPAFINCENIKKVVIQEGVTKIRSSTFQGCINLKEIIIPESITSIESEAFEYCRSLSNIELPKGLKELGNSAFSNCTSLSSVIIPQGISKLSGTFYNCNNLKEVKLPDSVTELYATFGGCTNLSNIDIPNSVTDIGNYTFKNCSSLNSITIPESVEQMGSDLFYNCTNLKNIILPKEVKSTYLSGWFYNCINLESVVIPNNISVINSYSFDYCSNLKSITIPVSVREIGDAFHRCSNLTGVYISDIEAWCNIEQPYGSQGSNPLYYAHNLFLNNELVTNLEVPEGVSKIRDKAFVGCTSITSIKIPNSVTSIGHYAFLDCTSLTSINIPDSVTSIDNEAFEGCSSLMSVTIPDSVTSIDYETFKGCSSLTNITIPDSVISIDDSAFEHCSNLPSVTIPDSVTNIGDSAFEHCSSLTSITIPDGVTSIGNEAFEGCSSLTSITIPHSVTSIGQRTFTSCSSLTSITIPHSVTSIGEYAFWMCSSLTSITIPNSVTSIGKYAFCDCSSLKNITIPMGVTSIGDGTFSCCSNLTNITVPDSITSIGDWAFNQNINLSNVLFTGNREQWTSIEIGDNNSDLTDAAIHYNSVLIETVAPTCTNKGYDLYSCSECENGVKVNFTNALGHSFVDGICERCGINKADLIESEHPYIDNYDNTWSINKPNAKRIAITFSENTEIESSYDYIYLYDSSDNQIGEYSGTELAGKRVNIKGDTVKIRLVTDSSGTYYGFALANVQVYYEDCNHSQTELRNEKTATCGDSGYTGDICCVECDEVITKGEIIPKNDNHNYVNGFCKDCNAKDPDYTLPVINAGESQDVEIKNGGEYYYIEFTPKTNGTCTFYSTGNYDTCSYLYDEDMNELCYDDDGGESSNFSINYDLQANHTYVFECRMYASDVTGTFNITLEFDENLQLSLGDVNGDGKISILDATEIQKYIAQLSSLKDEQLAVADVNGDGKISIIDATEIQKYIAQLIPSLG